MNEHFDFNFSASTAIPLLARERLHPAAMAALDASASRAERWLIAFSGGADSLALLLAVWTHWPAQRERLIVCSFNHRLRGEESDADETFCAKVAGKLQIAFRAGHWADAPAAPSEDDARRARFDFFSRIATEEDVTVLLTGHHLNDVVETHFMRLARGASVAGLASPRPVRIWQETRKLIRPLLTLSGEQVRSALTEAGLGWREDASNRGDLYLRNRLRHHVVPAWLQATGQGALAGAALTREWLDEDDAALEQWLDELGIQRTATTLDLRSLAGKPRALLRRALRRWTPAAELSRQGLEGLLLLSQQDSGQMSVGSGEAFVKEGKLSWSPIAVSTEPWGRVSFLPGETVCFPDAGMLSVEWIKVDEKLLRRLQAKEVDIGQEAFLRVDQASFYARPWLTGDSYRPMGGGTSKVQDLFVNRKIDSARRSRLPVICGANDRILWVPGLIPAEQCKITGDCEMAVQLTYYPGTSTVR